jgi:uncharacterized repeat protein (TIGR03803 family)
VTILQGEQMIMRLPSFVRDHQRAGCSGLETICSRRLSSGRGVHTYATPVQGIDVNFYWATYSGAANGYGTVIKISPTGTLTTLHSFGGTDGSELLTGLVQGTNGNLHGTTYMGADLREMSGFQNHSKVHAA